MSSVKKLSGFLILATLAACKTGVKQYQTSSFTDAAGYTYNQVTNDPMQTRIYTLKNGLKVYLSVNKDAPRVMSLISVKAGSLNDPEETTGLAHYFEHLMFKGTSKFGTANWPAEKVLLDSISVLFEMHKATNDPVQKKKIYAMIDKVSHEAAKYAIPNEYDKMVGAIGAKETNAFTSWETTTYVNDVPSNEINKWLAMEKERFTMPVLRLFHTELETVYEEFNMGQDRDGDRQFQALMEGLFPHHPLGRDVIGLPEHLKNPSQVNIMKFFDTWYVPNNMAIILSGDIDCEATIKAIDSTFGQLASKPLPEIKQVTEAPITAPVVRDVYGPDAESLYIGYRFGGDSSFDKPYVTLIDYLLSNSTAGLFDIDLNQQQKVLGAQSFTVFTKPYGFHVMLGRPREGQKLEEVKDLILSEIEKIKSGNFDEWLLKAVVNDMRVQHIKQTESNMRVYDLLDAYILDQDYAKHLAFFNQLDKISKTDLIQFAKEKYADNYVVVYKRTGEAKDIVKVEKPALTPIEINRADQSDFLKAFIAEKSPEIKPVFVDYNKEIVTGTVNGAIPVSFVPNVTNELFNLNLIYDMGKDNDVVLPVALRYLNLLGTDKMSADEVKKAFYKLGVSFNVSSDADVSNIALSGLQENLEPALQLLENLLDNVEADSTAYSKLVESILKERDNAKLNPNAIRAAVWSYGKYGPQSSVTNIISADALKSTNPSALVDKIKALKGIQHRFFFYGQGTIGDIEKLLAKYHKTPEKLAAVPALKRFSPTTENSGKVLFVDYDKAQVEVLLTAPEAPFDKETYLRSQMFNEYYGNSMSSVVFQEIREARALAYSAWAGYMAPRYSNEPFFVNGVVYTQADKMMDAVGALKSLLTTMVVDEKAFGISRDALVQGIETDRITKQNIFYSLEKLKKLGINTDVRSDIYNYAENCSLNDVQDFYKNHISNKNYTLMLIGKKSDLDFKSVQKLGEVKQLSLADIFGY